MLTRLWCGHCQKEYFTMGTVIRGGYVKMVVASSVLEHVCIKKNKPQPPRNVAKEIYATR